MKYVLRNFKTYEKPPEPRTVSSEVLNGLKTKSVEIVYFMCCKFALCLVIKPILYTFTKS